MAGRFCCFNNRRARKWKVQNLKCLEGFLLLRFCPSKSFWEHAMKVGGTWSSFASEEANIKSCVVSSTISVQKTETKRAKLIAPSMFSVQRRPGLTRKRFSLLWRCASGSFLLVFLGQKFWKVVFLGSHWIWEDMPCKACILWTCWYTSWMFPFDRWAIVQGRAGWWNRSFCGAMFDVSMQLAEAINLQRNFLEAFRFTPEKIKQQKTPKNSKKKKTHLTKLYSWLPHFVPRLFSPHRGDFSEDRSFGSSVPLRSLEYSRRWATEKRRKIQAFWWENARQGTGSEWKIREDERGRNALRSFFKKKWLGVFEKVCSLQDFLVVLAWFVDTISHLGSVSEKPERGWWLRASKGPTCAEDLQNDCKIFSIGFL